MGGKPSRRTKADRRLKRNSPNAGKGKAAPKGNAGFAQKGFATTMPLPPPAA